MNTTLELQQLEEDLAAANKDGWYALSLKLLLFAVFCITAIYFISFYIKKEIHQAIEDEDISGLVESGFDRVMENYEKSD